MPSHKGLASVTLREIWPRSISGDENMAALGTAVDGQRLPRIDEIREVLIWSRLDQVPDDVLAECALALHVEGFSESLSREDREQLVKESIPDHRLYGTPFKVKERVATFLGHEEGDGWEYRAHKHFRTQWSLTGARTLGRPVNRGYVEILIDSDLVRSLYPTAVEARAAVAEAIREVKAEHVTHRISFTGFYTGWSCAGHDRT